MADFWGEFILKGSDGKHLNLREKSLWKCLECFWPWHSESTEPLGESVFILKGSEHYYSRRECYLSHVFIHCLSQQCTSQSIFLFWGLILRNNTTLESPENGMYVQCKQPISFLYSLLYPAGPKCLAVFSQVVTKERGERPIKIAILISASYFLPKN